MTCGLPAHDPLKERYREIQGDTGRYREIQGDIGSAPAHDPLKERRSGRSVRLARWRTWLGG